MEVNLSKYYTDILEEIIGYIKSSYPGKRYWTPDSVTGLNDYSMTERSTFPDWVKFWYEKTPKRERFEYYISGKDPYEDGYFNGNTRDLLIMLNRAKDKGIVSKRSMRVLTAFDNIVSGYLEEREYLEEYYSERE